MTSETLNSNEELTIICSLVNDFKSLRGVSEKRILLESQARVQQFFQKPSPLRTYLHGLNDECSVVILSLIFLKQEHVFFFPEGALDIFESLRKLTKPLIEVEKFYSSIGGILGYHLLFMRLVKQQDASEPFTRVMQAPKGDELSENNDYIALTIKKFIETLPELAQLSPVAGAGERLGLKNKDGAPLPVARLNFQGYNLLEGMFRDIQSWEYLYYKLKGKTHFIPVGLMTSDTNDNHQIIENIVKENLYFGRTPSKISLFKQPAVPVISTEGQWLLSGPMSLHMRPGGHGAMWKQALDKGVFKNFQHIGVNKVFVRQVNNPAAAIDYSAIAFMGIGSEKDADFGFASCPRRVGAPEGMNVLCKDHGVAWISNIEYTDFQKYGIKDLPIEEGSPYSCFPSNTNILFADLKAAISALDKKLLFAPTVNLKSSYESFFEGETKEVNGGRVESMMQNLADEITTPLEDSGDKLSSFITFNKREKTISVTKKQYDSSSGAFLDTPYSCFYDLHKSFYELLSLYCNFNLAPEVGVEKVQKGGTLPFYYYHHPALGPTFSIIGQKVKHGSIAEGSYLDLEITELELIQLDLQGALSIHAKNPLGLIKQDDAHEFSYAPTCSLVNCSIQNEGLDVKNLCPKNAWEKQVPMLQSCQITLGECSELEAHNITFAGNIDIAVPPFTKMTVLQDETGELKFKKEQIDRPTWCWQYRFERDNHIILHKLNNERRNA